LFITKKHFLVQFLQATPFNGKSKREEKEMEDGDMNEL